ncbi:hypothetical protein HanIR_Chr11g0529541 [Helianthus annuus]|nr:hypothetical protein HanIR_Chr11g0529541 [Helianthus annuus]
MIRPPVLNFLKILVSPATAPKTWPDAGVHMIFIIFLKYFYDLHHVLNADLTKTDACNSLRQYCYDLHHVLNADLQWKWEAFKGR